MPRRDLKDLRIVVTGASEGIGRAIAVDAAARGMKVLATARKQADLEALKAEVPGIEILSADVTVPTDRAAMLQAIQDRFGGVDVLLNNAGIGATGHFMESEPESLRRIFETNYFGPAELIRLFLPTLKVGRTPAVVNISSILGRRGWPGRSLYCSSKFAIQGLSDALRAELDRFGVSVLVVNPGLTQTNFSKNLLERKARVQLDHLRGMSPQTVARRTLDALAADAAEISLTPRGLLLIALNRWAPFLIDRIGKRKVRRVFKDDILARYAEADRS